MQDLNISSKLVDRSKNFFALGMMYWMYGRPLETTIEWLKVSSKANQIFSKLISEC